MKIGRLVNEKVLLTFLCSMISLLTLSSILSHIDIKKDTSKAAASVNDAKEVRIDQMSEYSKQNNLTIQPEETPAETEVTEETAPEEQTVSAPEITTPTGTTQEYQEYARSQFSRYGWTDEDFNCLVALWTRESGWNPSSHSSSGAHGIPQALPASKMAAYGDDYMTNYVTQINWGLDYISARYGSPSAAWSNFMNKGWY